MRNYEQTAQGRNIDNPVTEPWYCDECGYDHRRITCPMLERDFG